MLKRNNDNAKTYQFHTKKHLDLQHLHAREINILTYDWHSDTTTT